MITVALRGNGDAPLDHVRVLLNDADGTLVRSLLPSELPTEVEVFDGQLVTFLLPDQELHVDSFRVTPAVSEIVGGVEPTLPTPTCELEPMTVTVDFAGVPGATQYYANWTGASAGSSLQTEPGLMTLDVTTCDATFDLIAYARDGAAAILGHDLFTSLPFTPGGHLELAATLSSNDRGPLELTIENLHSAEHLFGVAAWYLPEGIQAHESTNQWEIVDPPSSLVWTPAPILPGGPGYGVTFFFLDVGFPGVGDACRTGVLFASEEPAPNLSQNVDLSALAPALGHDGTGWALSGPGEVGDHIRIALSLGGASGPVWQLHEDPTFTSTAPEFPQLPEDLPAELVPEDTSPILLGVHHTDLRGVAGYAEFAAGGTSDGSHRVRYASYACD